MTKPKFTPDPPPNIVGLNPQDALRQYVDWTQRQFNRAEDWWPKDLESRVQALELLVPYITGTWPIIDYSEFLIAGSGSYTVSSGACDKSIATYDHSWSYNRTETNFEVSMSDLWIREGGSRIYGASPGSGGLGSGIYQFDVLTPWDLTTIDKPNIKFFGVTPAAGAGSGEAPHTIDWKSDGSKFYTTDWSTTLTNGNARIREFGALNAWDVVGAVELASYNIESTNPSPTACKFSVDGLHIYLANNISDRKIYQYNMLVPWDLNTMTYAGVKTLSNEANFPIRGPSFDPPAQFLVVTSVNGAKVELYELNPPGDITTATHQATIDVFGTLYSYSTVRNPGCTHLVALDVTGTEFDLYTLG